MADLPPLQDAAARAAVSRMFADCYAELLTQRLTRRRFRSLTLERDLVVALRGPSALLAQLDAFAQSQLMMQVGGWVVVSAESIFERWCCGSGEEMLTG